MIGRSAVTSLCALMITTSLFWCAMPSAAMLRGDGDYWTYSFSGSMEGIDVTGEITYTFEEEDTINIGGVDSVVEVMSISGSAEGSMDLFGSPLVMEVDFGGHIYESYSNLALVKEDRMIWMNTTWGDSPFQIVVRSELEIVTTYSPPIDSGFNPEDASPGDEWTEIVQTNTTTTVWMNGTIEDQSTDSFEDTVSYVVAGQEYELTVPAGTFTTLRITSTHEDGSYEVRWYSDEVRNFVKYEEWEMGAEEPIVSISLSEYQSTDVEGLVSSTLIIVAAVVVAIVVILIVLALLLKKKRAPQPRAPPPGMQPPTPPPPPPPP